MLYQKGQQIGQYNIVFAIGSQDGGELYRVRDNNGHLCFLRLLFDPDSKELALRRNINHPSVCQWISEGTDNLGNAYYVTEFVSCETLSDRLRRCTTMSAKDVKAIGVELLRLLRTLHQQGIAHQAITTDSTLLNLTDSDIRLTAFGHAIEKQPLPQEVIDNDLLAVAHILFRALFAMEPSQPPKIPAMNIDDNSDRLVRVLTKALATNASDRFTTADEFLKALLGQTDVLLPGGNAKTSSTFTKPQGNGFADVAGMEDLKKLLNEEVLFVLRDRERALRYRLYIPNGMLLYGPPGCGKTFISERFAEEAGYNYRFIKSSDLASIYIHGSQQMIGELFDEARTLAPCVLCFDEFEALVPKRTEMHNAGQAGEVNEFLTQLNNCGKQQVFVIATTNQPLLIDSAVLRRGRIDHLIYVPMPDEDARAGMFAIHLKDRPCATDINYHRLAKRTDGYVASEIAFIANQAALRASRTDDLISQKLLEKVIADTKPRTAPDTKRRYEAMRQQLEQLREERPTIGFPTS